MRLSARAGARLLTGLALAWALQAVPCRPAQAGSFDITEEQKRALQHAQRLIDAGRSGQGFAVFDSLRAAAEAHRDETLRLRVLVARGRMLQVAGRAVAADSLLRAVMPWVLARGDTALFSRAAIWRGMALQEQGRYTEAAALYTHTGSLAAAAGDREAEGFLLSGLAYTQLLNGRKDEARAGYTRARELLRGAKNRFGELNALTGLGRAYHESGEPDRAIAAFREVATLARASDLPYLEANALNNIGTEQHTRGDPSLALASYRASAEAWKRVGTTSESVVPALNAARVLAELGRFGEASAVADSVLRLCRASSLVNGEIMSLNLLQELCAKRRDGPGLRSVSCTLLGLGERLPVGSQLKAWQAYATAAALAESTGRALEILERHGRPLRDRVSTDFAVEFDLDLCGYLVSLGRDDELTAIALAADRLAVQVDRLDLRVRLLTLAARADLRRGRSADALARLNVAVAAWESLRARPTDLEWRERRADDQGLCTALIQAHLQDDRVPDRGVRTRRAFDAAQRFKARTLLDRLAIRGVEPGVEPANAASAWTLVRLQAEVLSDRDLLLDAYEGPEDSYLFAVTRDRCEVITYDDPNSLAAEIRLFHDLVADPAAAGNRAAATERRAMIDPAAALAERRAMIDPAAAALADRVLGPARSFLDSTRRIIWAPDGVFNLLPLDVLPWSSPSTEPAGPIGSRLVIARVPSPSVFARTHLRAPGGVGPAPRGLVLSGDRNADGEPLPGAAAETRSLVRRFARIEAATDPARTDLGRFDFIHAAAHTELNDQYPWRSAILLAATDSNGTARRWPAEEIARTPVAARLVVLSGCASAGGSLVPGEGVLGISTAFLAAGVTSVVATLWPVEDEATRVFVERFYDALGRGEPVGSALRRAKAKTAASARYADPFYWAGFVLIGDPDLRLPLERRRGPAGLRWPAGLALLAVAGYLSGRVIRDRRRATHR